MKKENRYDLTGEMTDDYPFEVVWSAEHELIARRIGSSFIFLLKALKELTPRKRSGLSSFYKRTRLCDNCRNYEY